MVVKKCVPVIVGDGSNSPVFVSKVYRRESKSVLPRATRKKRRPATSRAETPESAVNGALMIVLPIGAAARGGIDHIQVMNESTRTAETIEDACRKTWHCEHEEKKRADRLH